MSKDSNSRPRFTVVSWSRRQCPDQKKWHRMRLHGRRKHGRSARLGWRADDLDVETGIAGCVASRRMPTEVPEGNAIVHRCGARQTMMNANHMIPLWIKLIYTAFVAVLVPYYWV